MAKNKKIVNAKKQKLTPAERSQVAKDRWAKIKADKAADEIVVTINTMLEQDAAKDAPVITVAPTFTPNVGTFTVSTVDNPIMATSVVTVSTPSAPPPPEQPPVTPESITGVEILNNGSFTEVKTFTAPAPQLAPVTPKKPKRIPVPKEFLTALKTADSLLAKAIEEYEDCQRRITYLSGSIPRLQRTVIALRNESNPDAPVPLPNAFNYNAPTAFQAPPNPNFQPHNPLAAIQAAMDAAQVALPVSRAVGGVQLSPDVIGSLEGPDDDDDEDRFITGAGEKGWIGG